MLSVTLHSVFFAGLPVDNDAACIQFVISRQIACLAAIPQGLSCAFFARGSPICP